MSLRSIELFHVAVPLRKPIRHASHSRTTSDNLVVRATLATGEIGYGEGVPRSYVTGETIDSTFEALGGLDAARQVGSPVDFPAAVRAVAALSLPEIDRDPRGMAANSARCALELALLDAYGRRFGRSVGEGIRSLQEFAHLLSPRPTNVRYSGAITAESERKEIISAWKMRLYGFHQVKVKVGVEGQNDPARLARLRRILGRRRDIRLDANEAWTTAEVVDRVRPLMAFQPSALEQPVPHSAVDEIPGTGLRQLVPVMLDESLCGYPDGLRAIERGSADIFNVRLSKCGGIVPSLRLVDLARRHGLDVQLGCHPGETGILSAAGRHFASNVAGLRFVEGSYDRHVLAANLIAEEITFRYGGRARPLMGPGLGVTVRPEALEAMTVDRRDVPYD